MGVIPNMAGTKIKDYWNKEKGHRRKGLTCMGDGNIGTGCHGIKLTKRLTPMAQAILGF